VRGGNVRTSQEEKGDDPHWSGDQEDEDGKCGTPRLCRRRCVARSRPVDRLRRRVLEDAVDAETGGSAPLDAPTTSAEEGGQSPGQVRISVMTVGPVRSDGGSHAPYAWINGGYVVRVGREATFDGSGSYARAGTLVSYAWDFDDDGVIDQTTATPMVMRRLTEPYSGVVVLTVTDSGGRTATGTAHLAVTDDGDEVPRDRDNCPDVDNMGQEDFDHDGIGDMCDPTPGWEGPDQGGVSASEN
jgi:hypothetical protein